LPVFSGFVNRVTRSPSAAPCYINAAMGKTLSLNKRAGFDYEFLDTFEAGLVLAGAEVKSVRLGHMQLVGSFLHIRGSELWLKNAYIAPYEPAGEKQSLPNRDRKVLVRRQEINRLIGKTQQEGLTLVPISVYLQRNLVKLKFALARGKKKYEKREQIKRREAAREDREYVS